MIRFGKTRFGYSSLALAASMAVLMAASPMTTASAASRHGSVSVAITPKGDSERVVREGLQLYSLFKGLKNRGKVNQNGSNNAAGIAQNGNGNTAQIVQRGSGNSGTITQNGNNNFFGLFQFGRNTNSNVTQNGNGRSGIILQGGW